MNRSGFMRLSVAMRTMRKAASGASAVTGFAFWKRQSWQEKSSLIFTTTLSISPLKRADKLNEIGLQLQQEYEVPYLFSDFKKKNGYLTSIRLSKEYNLYRQDYCGCVYSKLQREREKQKKEKEQLEE